MGSSSTSESKSQNSNESSPPGSSPANAPQSTPPTYPHWHDLIAGASAGLGARAVTAPLDLLKIRRQLQPPSTAAAVASATTANSTSAASSAATNATTLFAGGEWKIFHNLRSIAEKEGGVQSLFRGNVAASYLWVGYSVAQFWLYGYASQYLHRRYASSNPTGISEDRKNIKVSGAISFASGAISGLCATVVTYPLDLCRTVFAARGIFPIPASNVTWSNRTTDLASASRREYARRRPPKTLQEFARRVHVRDGFRGFYAGSAPGLLQIAPYMGINFALHDLLVGMSGSGDSWVSGVAGTAAGVVSKFLVYPLDTVKKRLQAQAFWGAGPGGGEGTVEKSTKYTTALPKNNKKRMIGAVNNKWGGNRHGGPVVYEGMLDCIKQIARREGIAAFYRGLIPSLLKSSVSTGASFWLFTLTKNALQSIHDSNHF